MFFKKRYLQQLYLKEMEAFPEESAFAGGNPWAAPSG